MKPATPMPKHWIKIQEHRDYSDPRCAVPVWYVASLHKPMHGWDIHEQRAYDVYQGGCGYAHEFPTEEDAYEFVENELKPELAEEWDLALEEIEVIHE